MYLFEVVEAFSARSEGLSAAPAQQGGDLLRELLGPVRAELRPPGAALSGNMHTSGSHGTKSMLV